ncbi:hypothetical protein V6N13_023675 [Hibiscus sabdariffa]
MGSTLGEKNQSFNLVDPNLAEFDENEVLRVARDHLRCGHKDNGMGSTLGEKNQSFNLVDPNLAEFDENEVLRVARDHLRCGHKDNGCKLQMKAKR